LFSESLDVVFPDNLLVHVLISKHYNINCSNAIPQERIYFGNSQDHVVRCRARDVDTEKIKNEYEKMVQGLREAQVARETDQILANPGNITILKQNVLFL
jgi:hypothetical protein